MSAAAVMALGRKSNQCHKLLCHGWYRLVSLLPYLRQSYENVTGYGNYYIEDSGGAGKSFFKKDSRKLTATKPAKKTGNWNNP